MGSSSEEDSYIMRETRLSDLVEDEKQMCIRDRAYTLPEARLLM